MCSLPCSHFHRKNRSVRLTLEKGLLRMPRSPDRRRRSFSPGRDRDRDRDRNRDRDRQDADRRRDRDNRERDRDNRERDRFRDERNIVERHGKSPPKSQKRRGRDRERRHLFEKYGYDWPRSGRRDPEKSHEPTAVLVIKGLRTCTLEDAISQTMEKRGSGPLKDVRIVRDKLTGHSRGFAFVEFLTARDAGRFIDVCSNDTLFVEDVPITMEFSRKQDDNPRQWTCLRCDSVNYKWSDSCMACNRKKPSLPSLDEVDPPVDGAAEAGSTPSNVLIFRGLDALSTELTITEAIRAHTALPIKDVRLIKDRLTNTSRGFCFVELNSVAEATQLLESLQFLDPGFSIDCKPAILGFARQPQVNPAQAKSGAAAIEAAQWSSGPKAAAAAAAAAAASQPATVSAAPAAAAKADKVPALDPQTAFEAGFLAAQQQASASLVGYHAATAQFAQQAAVASQAAKIYETEATKLRQEKQAVDAVQHAKNTTAVTASAVVTAAAPAIGPAPAPATATATSTSTATSTVMSETDATSAKLGSTYSFDVASGYYYDSSTGLYYDPSTHYHYNPSTQQYCYFDVQKQQYVPVMQPNGDDKRDKKKKKEIGVPSARKIARDMERWAKSLNAAKDATKAAVAATEAAKAVQVATQQVAILRSVEHTPLSLESLQAARQVEARFELGKKSVVSGTFLGQEAPSEPHNFDGSKKSACPETVVDDWKTKMNAMAAEKKRPVSPPPPVQQEEPSFVIPDGADPDPAHTDWKQMACLLCKRKFPNASALIRHQQLSALHRNNLAAKGRQPLPVTVQAPASSPHYGGGGGGAHTAPAGNGSSLQPVTSGARASYAESSNMMYRDRAAERRNLHGPSEPPRRSAPREAPLPFGFGGDAPSVPQASSRPPPVEEHYEQPTRGGIGSGNVGNRMMQAMGWSEGEGLGRHGQGRTDSVQAQLRASQAGLGARGSGYGAYVADSHRETMSRLTQARFREDEY